MTATRSCAWACWPTDVDPAVGGTSANPLDAALWGSDAARRLDVTAAHRVAELPFDHTRRAASTLVDDGGTRTLIVKGAPEQVLQRCVACPTAFSPPSTRCSPTAAGWWPWRAVPPASSPRSSPPTRPG